MRLKIPKAYVNGIRINYKVDGKGTPLVLIMGIGAPRWEWLLQICAFKQYYKVITFDNRGIGKTDKPSDPYTLRTMADDTVGLMDYLEIDKAHILAHSLGGTIAQEVTINYPERVRKLILASAFPAVTQRKGEIGEIAREILKRLGLPEDFSCKDARSVDIMDLMCRVLDLGFNKRLSKMTIVPMLWLYYKLCGSKGVAGQLEAVADANTLDRLHEIQAPTLMITGAKDRLVPPRCSDLLASMIPGAKSSKVPGGSHAFIMETRSRFNREVLDFFRGN